MNVPLPVKVINNEKEWNLYLCRYNSVLEKLWQQGKLEQFETYKVMSGLDYNTFFELWQAPGHYYAPYIPIVLKDKNENVHTNP